MIAVDDLRPQLGCLGDPVIRTPNVDRLAARGVAFARAYCQQAVCSPSRTSLMTGRRPDTTRVYDLETHFRDTIPDVVTLAEHFKAHGYRAESLSKIYHGGLDDPKSWSVPHWRPDVPGFGPEGQEVLRRERSRAREAGRPPVDRVRGLPTEAPDVPDDALPDGATASEAINRLRAAKDRDEPFFLAVGFLKPHLPFVAPKRYWDLYSESDVTLTDNPEPPVGAPGYADSNWGELRAYVGIPKDGPVSDEQARELIHGYYASVSYMDAQLGRVLDELDRLGLADSTIVALWGDHGWKLGDHGAWCKHTNYERDTNAPLIVSAPGRSARGSVSEALVEFVDLYPTLVDLCGLPMPDGLEGTSLAPLLDDPEQPWKPAAFSQYPRGIPGKGRAMGYAMRTDRHRFVAWTLPDGTVDAYELYDHQADPHEDLNLAADPSHADLVEQLAAQLQAGWQAARPPGS
jgi:arylsulfatase A-like enzyme